MCLEGGTLPFMSSCGIKTSVLRTNRRRVSVGPWRCCSARLPCLSGYQFLLVPQVCKEVSGRTDAEVRKHTEVRVPSLRHTFATNFVNGQKQPGGTIRKAIPSTAHITAIMQKENARRTESVRWCWMRYCSKSCAVLLIRHEQEKGSLRNLSTKKAPRKTDGSLTPSLTGTLIKMLFNFHRRRRKLRNICTFLAFKAGILAFSSATRQG